MFNVGLAGVHPYAKWLFTWLSLVMSFMVSYLVLSFFFNEMSWVRSGTELSQFVRIFLPTFIDNENFRQQYLPENVAFRKCYY